MTTDAQTEARAVARKILEDYGLDADEHFVLAESIATALAAKDAELAEVKEMYAREGAKALYELERADRAEAQLAEANKALEAAEAVVWFDWSENDPDAVAAIDALRRAVTAARRAREQGGE